MRAVWLLVVVKWNGGWEKRGGRLGGGEGGVRGGDELVYVFQLCKGHTHDSPAGRLTETGNQDFWNAQRDCV